MILRACTLLCVYTLCTDCVVNVSFTTEPDPKFLGADFNCLEATANPHSLAWNIMQFEASFLFLFATDFSFQ